MRLIITFLMAWCLSLGAYAATAPDAKLIAQELEQAKAAKPAQPEAVEALQSALNALGYAPRRCGLTSSPARDVRRYYAPRKSSDCYK